MKDRTDTLRILMGVALAALLGSATGAYAQERTQQAPQDETMSGAEAGASDITDDELLQFVDAALEVRDVQQDYSQRIQATEQTDEAQKLREEAQDEMISVVEDSGLSVTEYNLIAQRLQTDTALAQRLQELNGSATE